jgi:hypothetical protein
MAIRQFASVDPDALRETCAKIRQCHDDLSKVISELKKGLANLSSSGFTDTKFNELKLKMDAHNNDLQGLLTFMSRHEAYLKSQERLVQEYLNTAKLK